MGQTAEKTNIAQQAWEATARAAEGAEVTIERLSSLEQLHDAVELFDTVWSKSGTDQVMPLGVIRAISHAGSYVSGAYSSNKLVGALAGFLGGGDAEPHLHSHVLGVHPNARGGSVGFALKLHQRAWALEKGLTKVTWTFDPLVSRNAYFNLTKLGAGAGAYYENFYGRMDDAINAGEESDRLLVEWKLTSDKATAAADGTPSQPDIDGARSSGAIVALDEAPSGRPVTATVEGSDTIVCKTPADIVDLRLRSPDLAGEWRQAQRSVLSAAIQDGYQVDGVSRSGWYLLSRS